MKFLDRNPPQFTDVEAQEMAQNLFGLRGSLKSLQSERDQNYRLQTASGERFVLKISNAEESIGVVDFQTEGLRHLERYAPELAVPRVVNTVKGDAHGRVTHRSGATHMVRALTYLPGRLVADVERNQSLMANIGSFMARLDKALRGFIHPQARHEMLWDITQCAKLRPHTSHITNHTARKMVEQTLDHVLNETFPALKTARHQVIHGDAHRLNLLVNANEPTEVAGILDFGDMVYAPLVIEVVIAADVRNVAADKLIDTICTTVAAYDRVIPLEEIEIDSIYDLLLARLAVGATIIAWRQAVTPEQPDYLLDVQETFWQTLSDLYTLGRTEVRDRLRKACRFASSYSASVPDAAQTLLNERQRVLGKHLALFYQQPLHFERGNGVWLYDPQGQAYLDGYNNVPVVGHCHPHVVNAVSRQLGTLNTHTRYLYRIIVEYAERLLSTLPEHLNVCSFVNSGSEANDIAWRIAKFITGNEGALVMEGAYHGITDAIVQLSPSAGKNQPLAAHVKTLLTPDPYRGAYRHGEAELAQRYAADADRAIAELAEEGMRPAAFMVDTLFTSNGSPDVPPGYVLAVAQKVRKAGGLLIADEVQAGFARSGTHMWGHMLHGAHADIVTMGKPVGNGYPLGVIVTSAEILNRFVSEVGLFSTFGGNPVACAAGLAVLDVIEKEGLRENARKTGDYLRAGIRQLMSRHAWIGDVRGQGLMIAVELVRDRDSKEPATAETKHLIELMRQKRVLISNAGPFRNILKIRPPLVFRRQHADIMLEALDQSLAAL